MTFRVILILLFLISPTLADQIEITSLPFTITTNHNNDTLYLSGNLSATGTGITVDPNVNGFYFRGKGDTITFNTNEGSSVYGMHFATGFNTPAYDFLVDSLTVIEYGNGGEWVTGIRINAIHDAKFYDCNVHVKSDNSMCLSSDNGDSNTKSYNIEVKGGNYTNYVNGFDNRCQNKACCIKLVYEDTTAGDYNFWVHDVVIDSCPHVGILCSGKSYIDSNTIYGNAHNDTYTRPSGNACFSADNPYMVALASARAGSHAYGNYIRARDSYEGARGIMVVGANGTAENPIHIAYNDIDVTNGPSDDDGARPATRGIRLREDYTYFTFLRYLYVHDNIVVVTADTASATAHIGSDAVGIEPMNFSDSTEYVYIYNNTVMAMADSTKFCNNQCGNVLAFGPDGDSLGSNLRSYDNHYTSNCSVIGLHAIGPNYGVGNWFFERDTLEWLSPYYENTYNFTGIVLIGFATSYAIHHIMRDPIYIGYDGGLDSNAMNASLVGVQRIHHQKTMSIGVYGKNGLPVSGANVWVVNAYGDTVISDVTASNGHIFDPVAYDYDEWVSDVHTDSVYNDFTVGCAKSNDTTTVSKTVAWNDGDVDLVLDGINGDWTGGERTSVIFIHYSVGTSIVAKSGGAGSQHIRDSLNIPLVIAGIDTARMVFRSYRMNNDYGGTPLSDTVSNAGGGDDRFSGYTYEYVDPWTNRMRIWNSDAGFSGNDYTGLLEELFEIVDKEDSAFWRAFTTHNVPGTEDSVSENYALFMIKNPYACWACMTQAQADSIKILYQIVADSMSNHPEQNFALIFGTPLRLPEQGCGGDSSNAKITYTMATWFAETFDVSGYDNVWKYEFYRILCEMDLVSNRYCLDDSYWDGGGGSHLNNPGNDLAQDSLTAFTRRTIEELLGMGGPMAGVTPIRRNRGRWRQ